MKYCYGILLAGFLMAEAGCTKAAPELVHPATIKEIMTGIVNPSSEYLFESVQEIADEHGVTKKAPKTDDEWTEERRHILVLLEAPNLITMEGRKVAGPGEHSKNPLIEKEPEQVQQLLDGDRPEFFRRARRLQDAATEAMKAANAKDATALFHAIEQIDRACESCHLHYWYPDDVRAREAAKNNGVEP